MIAYGEDQGDALPGGPYPDELGTSDDFYALSPVMIEAEELRREAWADIREASERAARARSGLDQYGTRRMRTS